MQELLDPRRHITLDGLYNLRDIGGYRTRDNRHTRWRTLFRSASLHRLPPESRATLLSHGIRTIVDLRNTVQDAGLQYSLGGTSVRYIRNDLLGDEIRAEWEAVGGGLYGDQTEIMKRVYASILDRRREQIRATVAALSEPGALPALVHCLVGKDRTGVVCAIVLGVAGVPEETIAQDYALSGRYLFEQYLTEIQPPDVDPRTYSWEQYERDFCAPEVMLATLQHLDDSYGGLHGYLATAGVTGEQIDSLKTALLE